MSVPPDTFSSSRRSGSETVEGRRYPNVAPKWKGLLTTTGEVRAKIGDAYLLGSYRIATAPEANSSRLMSFKSIRLASPANDVGPWPASLGCATNSYSSINPSATQGRDPAAQSSVVGANPKRWTQA